MWIEMLFIAMFGLHFTVMCTSIIESCGVTHQISKCASLGILENVAQQDASKIVFQTCKLRRGKVVPPAIHLRSV